MYSFRQATVKDYAFLYRLHAETIHPYVDAIWGWNDVWQREYFKKKFDPFKRQIIQLNGQDVGVLVVEHREKEVFIALIEILPAFQSQGIGTTVICDILMAAQAGRLPVKLQVLKSNTRARQLYERLGFVITATEQYHYQMTYLAWEQEATS